MKAFIRPAMIQGRASPSDVTPAGNDLPASDVQQGVMENFSL
jgi:hypothetical protein